jgi:GTP pyrophosphokinase
LSRIVDKALEYASDRYRGQKDEQGRPYFFAHTVQVFSILKDISDDEEVLAAGILHDILEDSDTTYEDLIHEFNRPIADLVMELTHEESEEGGYYFPRLESRKAVLVKFADRLSNLSRMGDWPGDRQQRYLEISKFWPKDPPGDSIHSPNPAAEARDPRKK